MSAGVDGGLSGGLSVRRPGVRTPIGAPAEILSIPSIKCILLNNPSLLAILKWDCCSHYFSHLYFAYLYLYENICSA